MATILIVDDDRKLADANFQVLKHDGHTVHVAYELDEGLKAMENHQPEVILCDLVLGSDSGLQLLSASRTQRHLPDVILVTGHPTEQTAAEAMSLGAYEYMRKPYAKDELTGLVRRILDRRSLLESRRARRRDKVTEQPLHLIGDSKSMKGLLSSLDDVAPRQTTVLLRGETGTGKELLTRYIHANGPNADGPFVAINCAAIPENLLASELFGHEKGAFTGAVASRAGAFERSSKGTLLLDEIGDIPASTQVHLLRVIESCEVIRVGGSETIAVNPRLVAATHRDLEALVRQGQFREDLYYRINVYPVSVPPLRAHISDLDGLVHHFLRELDADEALLSPCALESMKAYRWPGNVRELRNLVENIVIRSRGNPVDAEKLKQIFTPLQKLHSGATAHDTLESMEIRRIEEALTTADGNKSHAAEALGITRRKLYSRMKVLGMRDSAENV